MKNKRLQTGRTSLTERSGEPFDQRNRRKNSSSSSRERKSGYGQSRGYAEKTPAAKTGAKSVPGRKYGKRIKSGEMEYSKNELERLQQEKVDPLHRNVIDSTVIVKDVRIGEGMPKICVPIVGVTADEILTQASQILYSPADIIEWRADYFRRSDDKNAVLSILRKLQDRLEGRPVLFTFRTAEEGGEKEISTEDYVKLCEAVILSGNADLIDIQYSLGREVTDHLISVARPKGVAVILSYHDFKSTPPEDDIVQRLITMKMLGADIAKIAVMPQNARDVISLMSASERMRHVENPIPVVAISMSVKGVVSRISGEVFGSAMTFATAGRSSAPGQIDADQVDRLISTIHRGTDHDASKADTAEVKDNVILIGFMGTGKTTVARRLSQKTGLQVKEIDDMIVAQEGMSIKDIFDRYGEEYFRNVETRQAEIISESSGVIVSCGGGTVMRQQNVDYLRKNGTIILLHASPDTVFERVRRGGDKRPLLNKHMARGFISWLMKKRNDAYYAAADVIIYTDGMNSDRVADEIIKIMKWTPIK